jgi:hypothetical protein
MWHSVGLVRADVSVEPVATCSSETSVLTKPTRRHFPEDGIIQSHRREILKSYITLTGWAL